MKRTFILFLLLTIGKFATAQYTIDAINSTDIDFDMEVVQTGTITLDTSDWWGRTDQLLKWLEDTVVLTVEQPLLSVDDTLEFHVVFRYAGDSIKTHNSSRNNTGIYNK